MSTAAQPSLPATTMMERRLYPRIVPRNPVYLTLDGINQSLLLNISENGLLVSTPVPLPGKFAALTAIPLDKPLQPLLVNIRVVWTSESRMLAGIRLVDLTEYQREQIRRWSGVGSAEVFASAPRGLAPASGKLALPSAIAALAQADSTRRSLQTEVLEAREESPSPSYGAWLAKPLKSGMPLAVLLSLAAILWLSPKIYLVKEILALIGILAVIAFIAVSLLLLAMFLWEGLQRGCALLQKRRLTAQQAEPPLQEILAEIPECSVTSDLLPNP